MYGYWVNISGITYPYDLNGIESERATVYNKAVAYGDAKGGEGRLLTYSEFQTLGAKGQKMQKILNGSDYSVEPTVDNILYYWLGTAEGRFYVDCLYYTGCPIEDGNDGWSAGVRPVVTVSKSLITSVID